MSCEVANGIEAADHFCPSPIAAHPWISVDLPGVRPEYGDTVTLASDGTTTKLEGSEVVIIIRDPAGTRVFEGTLSDHPNKMTIPVAEQIEWGDSKDVLPDG